MKYSYSTGPIGPETSQFSCISDQEHVPKLWFCLEIGYGDYGRKIKFLIDNF